LGSCVLLALRVFWTCEDFGRELCKLLYDGALRGKHNKHRELDQAVIEVKRMLAGLLQKLNADRLIADSSDRMLLFSEIVLA